MVGTVTGFHIHFCPECGTPWSCNDIEDCELELDEPEFRLCEACREAEQ